MDEFITVPDKILHCLARIIQDEYTGEAVKCLYCIYAKECAEEYKTSKQLFFSDVILELQKRTSVKIFLDKKVELLEGSWIEQNEEMLKKFTNMSFEEQLDSLLNPNILR